MTVTCARGTAAPCGSVTEPLRLLVVVSWANEFANGRRSVIAVRNRICPFLTFCALDFADVRQVYIRSAAYALTVGTQERFGKEQTGVHRRGAETAEKNQGNGA